MSIAVYLPSQDKIEYWCSMLKELMPGWRIEGFDAVADPEAVHYTVVWRPATGSMTGFPNLKAIVSLGAGIDHVLADAELPAGVPIIRTVGTDLVQRMREYVALHVLRHHRNRPAQQLNQVNRTWEQIVVPPATGRRVGIMGLGNLGVASARTLAALGFQTVAWARTRHQVEGVTTYAGTEEFPAFLAGTEILVCLLPLTTETRGILNADTFNQLKRGACVVNAARGPHLVDSDLLRALDSGQIAQATLDVFNVEPLPADHPFWGHPRITVTPHIASMIDAPTGSGIVAANIQVFEATGTVADIADTVRGY